MSKQKLIQQGAEAKILLNSKKNLITKNRIKKLYRIKEIDNKIRKQRTKKEVKLLEKASKIINAPLAEQISLNEMQMPYIKGKKLSDNLDKFNIKKQIQIARQIGKDIAKLHNSNIIHGDLTTSNMILVENEKLDDKKNINNKKTANVKLIIKGGGGVDGGLTNNLIIFFIDFGLGYISHKLEDKAVDLHLLKQALGAKHYKNYNKLWKAVEQGYILINQVESKKVLERLKAVERRGRYKKAS